MRLLLDTHVLLWWLADDPKLPHSIRAAVETADEVVLSAATAWEIAVKRAAGRLTVPFDDFEALATAEGFSLLPMTAAHAWAAGALPRHHGDPFDRILVAQAILDGLVLVSIDGMLRRYDVALLPVH